MEESVMFAIVYCDYEWMEKDDDSLKVLCSV